MPEFAAARPPAVLAAHVRRYLGFREFGTTPVRRRRAPVGSRALIVFFGFRREFGVDVPEDARLS